jgi:CHASE2 domain-containing sensor protein
MRLEHRITQALTVIVVVCVGVRLAAWLITPLLPALAVLFVFATILAVVTKDR